MWKPDEVVYKIHQVEFEGKPKQIICQKDIKSVRTCPLVTLANFMILKQGLPADIKLNRTADGSLSITTSQISAFVYNSCAVKIQNLVDKGLVFKDIDKTLKAIKGGIELFPRHLDLYAGFRSTTSFANLGTAQRFVFVFLGVDIYHGWLPDPIADVDTYNALHELSALDLLIELEKFEKSKSETAQSETEPCGGPIEEEQLKSALKVSEGEHIKKMMLFKNFCSRDLTPYGYSISCLQKEVPEQLLSLLYLYNQFYVLYKKGGILHSLEIDEVLLKEYPNFMWKTVVDGNGEQLLTSSFTAVNLWREMASELIEEEREEKEKKEVSQKKKGKKLKQKKATQKKTVVSLS